MTAKKRLKRSPEKLEVRCVCGQLGPDRITNFVLYYARLPLRINCVVSM
jgi:hypothetical protein